jgi:hypothetical protein
MDWNAIGAIAETLGAIGVIVTVAYLAIQIRQNTQTVRSAAQQAMFDNTHETRLALSQDPHLAGLLIKANQNYDALTDEERVRFDSFAGLVFGQWENVYFQRDHAAVDPEMWSAWDASYREVAGAPSFRRVWEIEKHRYIPGFRNHVDRST